MAMMHKGRDGNLKICKSFKTPCKMGGAISTTVFADYEKMSRKAFSDVWDKVAHKMPRNFSEMENKLGELESLEAPTEMQTKLKDFLLMNMNKLNPDYSLDRENQKENNLIHITIPSDAHYDASRKENLLSLQAEDKRLDKELKSLISEQEQLSLGRKKADLEELKSLEIKIEKLVEKKMRNEYDFADSYKEANLEELQKIKKDEFALRKEIVKMSNEIIMEEKTKEALVQRNKTLDIDINKEQMKRKNLEVKIAELTSESGRALKGHGEEVRQVRIDIEGTNQRILQKNFLTKRIEECSKDIADLKESLKKKEDERKELEAREESFNFSERIEQKYKSIKKQRDLSGNKVLLQIKAKKIEEEIKKISLFESRVKDGSDHQQLYYLNQLRNRHMAITERIKMK